MTSWHPFKHGIAKGQTRALRDCHLDSSKFLRLLSRLQVFGRITLNIFTIQMLCTVMQLFNGSYFSVDAASRRFWPNLAIGITHLFYANLSLSSLDNNFFKKFNSNNFTLSSMFSFQNLWSRKRKALYTLVLFHIFIRFLVSHNLLIF